MENIKLFQGDCLEEIKKVSDSSVQLVLTDPPYCIGTTSNGTKGSFTDNNLIKPFFDILFSEYKRVLKPTGSLYINTDWRTYPFLYPILQKYFSVRNCIVWDYEWLKAGTFYRFQHEFIMFATMPECRRTFGGGERDIWRIRCINYTDKKNKLHQAQKPVELLEKAINNSSKIGDTVLDTFMGSGSTGVACVNTNRNFIGIELDEHYFEVAKKRIEDAQKSAEEGGAENGRRKREPDTADD